MSSASPGPHRVFGLDLLRAIAVLLVLVGHSAAHHSPPEWFRWFWRGQGTLGVEIFYVLSGYLIGGILLRLAKNGQLHTLGGVWDFWQRRWARTLPLYVFFVLVYLRFDYLGVAKLETVYPYAFFMQNFAWSPLPFFTHSWSLAVEEWFYFLFPLVLLALLSRGHGARRGMLLACLVFIAVPLAMKIFVARNITSYQNFDGQLRMVVLARLDAIAFGVLMALLKSERPALFARLRRLGVPALAVLAGAMLYLAQGAPGLIGNPTWMVLFFPALSLLLALCLPAVESVASLGWRPLDGFIRHTSLISYSLYLGHICMITLTNSAIDMAGVRISGGWQTLAVYAAYAFTFYGFATLTYFYVEKPYLDRRDSPVGHLGRHGRPAASPPGKPWLR